MAGAMLTKRLIAQEMKALVIRKGVEHVTISDIAQACGLNRQTFYYHFQDKYELLNWIYYTELIAPMEQEANPFDWKQKFLALFQAVLKDGPFYTRVFSASFHGELEDYLYSASQELFLRAFTGRFSKNSTAICGQIPCGASLYAHGVVGVLREWVDGGMRETPEKMAEDLAGVVSWSLS